ncbi:2-hydroxy-6-oxo-6-phenylhexa-2,4-dienoate hydrolase [[Actinomadura] parvosata subsp. kistnae]|uniref:Alpha/beta hydrolase n=1 Tax=[Actinomadura] parvosata subsp. kistnae TaxID=1909395 RepID=A0A1V0A3I4_9ACTN|nr:alpha/beta hydrolase [Nonomuraea sp. ATCC 55076]AQZ64719.1 alpha/beta hydrolase [Nonomuraea sp. ATCC 55076]SPL98538.1 2-hydroxy-6-oxo-6-phenylhexa-2,4-dienoate hydrolase [Actinomadura parvosata subsp. kistnae]
MHDAIVHPSGARMRWVELPGEEPARVYVHGLGATSAPYYAEVAAHPLLPRHRSLLIDLLGFGISDRPREFSYTLEEHADTLAEGLRKAGVAGAAVIAHSMGGAVATVMAARHPELVARLILVDANLDPYPRTPVPPGGSGIAAYGEEEFVAEGWKEVRDRVGPHWWSTMRLADLRGLHRTAVSLAEGTVPTMRELLVGLAIPRAFLYPQGAPPAGAEELRGAGVRVLEVPESGHNIMLDNPEAFARTLKDLLP